MEYPTWVNDFRCKGQEIKKIRDKYWVDEVSAYYDKEKKRTIKKSGKYIGRLTTDSLLTKENKLANVIPRKVSVKELGASSYLITLLKDEIELLQQHLPLHWESLLICSIFRILHQSAFRQINWYCESSYLSETYPNLPLSGKQISS